MENLINATNLSEIAFPVFKIGIHKPQVEEGLVFYYYEREEETADETISSIKYKIVDDRNLPGETLSRRRLALQVEGANLAKLGQAVYFLGDLVKLATLEIWFIDSLGKIFNYKKSTRARLKFYKISKIIPITTGGVVVEAEGLMQRFKSLYKPTVDKQYVGLLHFGMSLVLYGFYEQKHDETWRMV